MSFPYGSIPLIVSTLAILAILFIIKSLSVDIKKGLYSALVGTILALFFGIYAILWYQDRPFVNKPRIAFFPVLSKLSGQADSWLSWAVAEEAAQILAKRTNGELIINPPSQCYEAAEVDSLSSVNYLFTYAKRISADYVVLVGNSSNSAQQKLLWSFHDLKKSTQLDEQQKEISAAKIHVTVDEIVDRILTIIPVQTKNVILPKTSTDALKPLALAQFHYLQNDIDRTISFAEKAFLADSTNLIIRNLLTRAQFHKGLIQENQGKPAQVYYRNGKRLCGGTLKSDSTNAEANRLMGHYYILTKRWEQAFAYLKKALQLNPSDLLIYRDFAQLHPSRFKKPTHFKTVEKVLRYVIFLNPAAVEARLALADHYYFNRQMKQSEAVVKEILAINPNNIDGLMYLGKIYISRGQVIDVLNVFLKIIELDPDNADAFYNLGLAYYNTDKYEDAERFFKRAVEIDAYQRNAYLYLAYLNDRKGDKEKAIEYYRLRLRYRKSRDDKFAEEARRRLFELTHPPVDSTGTAKK